MMRHSGLALLLVEDFDRRAAPPPPDIETLLEAARQEARADLARSFDTRSAAAQEALASACAALAATLGPALDALDAAVAETARSLTETIFAGLRAALPAWSEVLSPAIGAEIAATLLRALGEAAAARLLASPADVEALRPLLPPGIALAPDPAMAPGALRFAWHEGCATREPAAIWNGIETILSRALAATHPPTDTSRPE